MNRKIRFSVATLVAVVLVLLAANAWAAPKFRGTVPPPPEEESNVIPSTGGGDGCDGHEAIDMGTAQFSDQVCGLTVDRVIDPEKEYPLAPDPLAFVGDTFKATTAADGALVQVCYAYPPEFADKNAKLYRLNDTVTPNVWEEVQGAVIANGQLCGTSTAGVFTLFGTK